MYTPQKLIPLLVNLRMLVIKQLRLVRIPVQATIPGLVPPAPPWYIALMRICITTIIQVVGGFSLAVALVVTMHYLGF